MAECRGRHKTVPSYKVLFSQQDYAHHSHYYCFESGVVDESICLLYHHKQHSQWHTCNYLNRRGDRQLSLRHSISLTLRFCKSWKQWSGRSTEQKRNKGCVNLTMKGSIRSEIERESTTPKQETYTNNKTRSQNRGIIKPTTGVRGVGLPQHG